MATIDNLRNRAKKIRSAFLPSSITNEEEGSLFFDIINYVADNSVPGGGATLDKKYWTKEELKFLNQYITIFEEKIKACYADKSGDSELWNAHKFIDYINQPLRKTDPVSFKNVTAEEVITRQLSTPEFVSGMLGSGTRLKGDHLELDCITVRKKMIVRELLIEKVKSIGGTLILSAGAMKITVVEDGGSYFKCLFDSDGGTITNPFVIDDQVLCQTFTGSNAKRYWRKVTSIGLDYFNLSKTDCEVGSANPEGGDEVVQLGNRTDVSRQCASILCAVGIDAPYYDNYSWINSFDLTGKLITREGNLAGIVDDIFGQLTGSGLYAKNVYLRGQLALQSGEKVAEKFTSLNSELTTTKQAVITAQQTANLAQQTANDATTSASNANISIGKLSDDNLISSIEKPTLKKEWDAIFSEKPLNSAQADKFSVDKVAYQSAYDALNNLIGINLNDLTSDWVVIGETLRGKFKDYYTSRTNLLNAISAKSKQLADAAQNTANDSLGQLTTVKNDIKVIANAQDGFSVKVSSVESKVNNIQIGGTNLLPICNLNPIGYKGNSTKEGSGIDTIFKCNYPNNWAILPISTTTPLFPINTDFVISFDLRNTNLFGFEVTATVGTPTIIGISYFANTTNEWKRFSIIYNSGNRADIGGINLFGVGDVRHIKIEKGNKASDWSPSPADQRSETEHIAQLKSEAERVKAEAYADGKVTAEEKRAIADAQDKLNIAVTEAVKIALGNSWSGGKILYPDPTFKEGQTVSLYNNLGNGNVILTRIPKLADSPFDSVHNIEIKNIGVANPELGGFYFGHPSRVNAIFICRFIAKIPVGYNVIFNTNEIGNNPQIFFTTSAAGTGKWEEYISVVKCGDSGVFGGTNYYAIDGAVGTPSAPVIWYLAYASVFDVTDGVNAQTLAITAQSTADAATAKLTDWSSDSKISPTEKTGLKQQLSDIQAEYSGITKDINRLNLQGNRVWASYGAAYDLAISALTKYSAALPEIINIDADYSNIAAYYPKKQDVLNEISMIGSNYKLSKTIDTTAANFDRDKYYPVIMFIDGGVRAKLKVETSLYRSGVPPWAQHSSGFSCECSWEANASGWGGKNMNRYINSFEYHQTATCPIGSIGQVYQDSAEYIHVRGGGIYYFTTENVGSIEVIPVSWTGIGGVVATPITSIVAPVVDVDAVRTEMETQITQTKALIELRATKTEFDALGQRLTTAESKITQTSSSIELMVLKSDILNIQGTSIKLKPEIIEITGATVFRNLSGDQINFFGAGEDIFSINGKYKVNKLGKATMTDADISGRVVATSGKIGGFGISGESLTNEGFNNDATVIFRNDNDHTFAAIGGTVLPPSTGIKALLKISNEKYNPYSTNYGGIFSVSGGNNNIAIQIDNGGIVMERQGQILLKANNNSFIVEGVLQSRTDQSGSYPLGTFLADIHQVYDGYATLRIKIR